MTQAVILLTLLVIGCAPAATRMPEPPPDATAPRAELEPMMPDDDGPDPCERVEVVWIGKRRVETPLPCKEFDRRRDLGRPLP